MSLGDLEDRMVPPKHRTDEVERMISDGLDARYFAPVLRPQPEAVELDSGFASATGLQSPFKQTSRSFTMVEQARGEMFLGGIIDPATGEKTDENVLYESHHLTTHGVIVGMTGSGKTGLGMVALEEALLSGIPCLIIDPKGDMGNLLLNFPSFAAEDFLPWVDEGEARRKDQTPEVFAAATADMWKNGLEGWGIAGDRLRQLGMTADFQIYSPGSTSGIPLNIVGSLAAPDLDWATEAETIRAEIEGFVSSLLVLAGIEADPISSPEHILLSTIIEKSWTEGRDLDLATLIGQVQTPPMRKMGVFELDTFFPPKDRTKLAMKLNGLVASPSFSSWTEGPPLDIQNLLYTSDGKPRASVMYLSHLSDTERQFVITLLLSKVVTWMRSQQGTSDLRALVYMDEVFGFAPPTANPPSKKPILTLLKQARAFGVGLLLSTQNPVDLDYKAMSNAGTWMIGRLQTERDKARIVEGLKSASGEVDIKMFDQLISDLGKRQFVLHSTRAKAPRVFTTRWAQSYLAGPLSREQIQSLTADSPERSVIARTPQQPAPVSAGTATGTAPTTAPAATASPSVADDESPLAPQTPDNVRVYYADPAAPWASEVGIDPTGTRLEPGLIARVDMVFDDQYADVNHKEEWEAIFFPLGDRFEPEQARVVDYDPRDLQTTAPEGCTYALVEAKIDTKTFYNGAKTELKEWLYRNQQVSVLKNPTLKLYSRIGETPEDFAKRCESAAEDAADEAVAKLKDKYKTRIRTVQDQLANAERRVRELETDVQGRRQGEMISGAGDLLGAILGGRSKSRAVGSAASRRRVTRQTQERLRTAEEKMTDKTLQLDDLEDELEEDVNTIMADWEDASSDVETVEIGLEKTDISVDEISLVWFRV